MQSRRAVAAVVLAVALLAAGVPAAQANTTQIPAPGGVVPGWGGGAASPGSVGMSGCGPAHGSEGQGGSGGSNPSVCAGSGLIFVGPSTNLNTAIGPTIISPGFAGVVTVSNGPVAIGP